MGKLITADDFKPETSAKTQYRSGVVLRAIAMHLLLGIAALINGLLTEYVVFAVIFECFAGWKYVAACRSASFSKIAFLRWLAVGDLTWISVMAAMVILSGRIPFWAWGLAACLALTIMVVRVILAMGFDIEAFDRKLQRRKQVTPDGKGNFLLHQLADFYDEDLLLGRDLKRMQWKVGGAIMFTGIAIAGGNGVMAYKAGADLQIGIFAILAGLGMQLCLSRTLSDWIVILRLEQLYRHRSAASASK